MTADTKPHDLAGELEKGRIEESEYGSPGPSPTTTIGGSALGTSCDSTVNETSPPPSPGSGKAWLPGRKRVASWIAQRSPTTQDPNNMAPRGKPIVRALDDSPKGYPLLSAYLDSDEQFMIYRRFGTLHARALLYTQDELRELEAKLDRLDKRDFMDEGTRGYLQCRENDDFREPRPGRQSRKELMAAVKQKTLEYGQLMMQAQQLCAMNKPSYRDQRSVTNFIENEGPLTEKEAQFIYYHEDLVTLRPGREHAWLDCAVENCLIWLRCRPIEYLFVSPLTRLKTRNQNIRYYTRSRINLLTTAIITAIILVLLIVPIYALYRLTVLSGSNAADPACIGVLLVFTLVFSATLSLFTKARRHEILAAAAAYCAVLVVFVGNVG